MADHDAKPERAAPGAPASQEESVESLVTRLEELDRDGILMLGDVIKSLTGDNLDAVIERLPARMRDWVVWELRDGYGPEHGPAEGYILIEGVTTRDPEAYQRDKERREAHLRQVTIPAIRDWLDRHPIPSRTEPFPLELVTDLLARVGQEVQALGRTRPTGQPGRRPRWPEGRRWSQLAGLDHDLETALHRAQQGAVGSPEHALAWEGLERALRELEDIWDLTQAERRFLTRPLQGDEWSRRR